MGGCSPTCLGCEELHSVFGNATVQHARCRILHRLVQLNLEAPGCPWPFASQSARLLLNRTPDGDHCVSPQFFRAGPVRASRQATVHHSTAVDAVLAWMPSMGTCTPLDWISVLLPSCRPGTISRVCGGATPSTRPAHTLATSSHRRRGSKCRWGLFTQRSCRWLLVAAHARWFLVRRVPTRPRIDVGRGIRPYS